MASFVPDWLMSGSDDKNVRVWNTSDGSKNRVMKGHTRNVRALLWNPEIPYIACSGSWDGTIIVWDVRSSACLKVLYDHHADVYGLTTHPHRPFLMASTSRDTTLRLWMLESVVSPLRMHAFLDRSLENVVGDAVVCMRKPGNAARLCGAHSKSLQQQLRGMANPVEAYSLLSQFFFQPKGVTDLWALAASLAGEHKPVLLPDRWPRPDVGTSGQSDVIGDQFTRQTGVLVPSVEDVMGLAQTQAQEFETVRLSRHGAGVGSMKKEERLMKAAKIHLRLGHIEQYCKTMIEIGEWDKALCMAPAVSMDYWKELMDRRGSALAESLQEEAVEHYIGAGSISKLVNFYLSRRQLEEAILVAQVDVQGGFSSVQCAGNVPAREKMEGKEAKIDTLHFIAHTQAANFFRAAEPILAACCHLSVGAVQSAVNKLVRSNEVELAYAIVQVLQAHLPSAVIAPVIQLTLQRCQRLGLWLAGISRLPDQLRDPMAQRALMAASFTMQNPSPPIFPTFELPSVADLYQAAGLRTPEQYVPTGGLDLGRVDWGEDWASDSATLLQLLVGRQYKQALELGVEVLYRCLSTSTTKGPVRTRTTLIPAKAEAPEPATAPAVPADIPDLVPAQKDTEEMVKEEPVAAPPTREPEPPKPEEKKETAAPVLPLARKKSLKSLGGLPGLPAMSDGGLKGLPPVGGHALPLIGGKSLPPVGLGRGKTLPSVPPTISSAKPVSAPPLPHDDDGYSSSGSTGSGSSYTGSSSGSIGDDFIHKKPHAPTPVSSAPPTSALPSLAPVAPPPVADPVPEPSPEPAVEPQEPDPVPEQAPERPPRLHETASMEEKEEMYQAVTTSHNPQEAARIIKLLSLIPRDIYEAHTTLRAQVLACSAYIGLLQAIWRGYTPIIEPLVAAFHAQTKNHAELYLPFPHHLVDLLALQYISTVQPPLAGNLIGQLLSKGDLPESARVTVNQIKTRLQRSGTRLATEEVEGMGGRLSGHNEVIVAASTLPAGTNRRAPLTSMISRRQIQGPEFLLEDGTTVLSMGEAIMWAKVNPFSPLSTGERLNPF